MGQEKRDHRGNGEKSRLTFLTRLPQKGLGEGQQVAQRGVCPPLEQKANASGLCPLKPALWTPEPLCVLGPWVLTSHFPTLTLGFVFCQRDCPPALRAQWSVPGCKNRLWVAGFKAKLPMRPTPLVAYTLTPTALI